MATFLAGMVLSTLYACFAGGFSIVRVARENLRATQIIVERMEAIRLSPYKSLTNAASFPASVTEYYNDSGQTNGTAGAAYTVTYNWAPGSIALPPAYRTNMLLITVGATWKSGNVQRSRSMQTYAARWGIQRYVSGN